MSNFAEQDLQEEVREEGWQRRMRHYDRYMPAVRHILADILIVPSTARMDQVENTDLFILNINDNRIAVGICDYKNYQNFFYQHTIRSKLDSGAKTELQKIHEGWGDIFIYGFAHPTQDKKLIWWIVINLNMWRKFVWNNPDAVRVALIHNRDDGTHGLAFDIRDFGNYPDLILGLSFPDIIWPDSATEKLWKKQSRPFEEIVNLKTGKEFDKPRTGYKTLPLFRKLKT